MSLDSKSFFLYDIIDFFIHDDIKEIEVCNALFLYISLKFSDVF